MRNLKSFMKKTVLVGLLFSGIMNVYAIPQGDNQNMNKKVTQTAGRTVLGKFAPEFAHYNDDVLFGENWNNQDLTLKTRSLITVVALVSSGITDSSLKYHLENAKKKWCK